MSTKGSRSRTATTTSVTAKPRTTRQATSSRSRARLRAKTVSETSTTRVRRNTWISAWPGIPLLRQNQDQPSTRSDESPASNRPASFAGEHQSRHSRCAPTRRHASDRSPALRRYRRDCTFSTPAFDPHVVGGNALDASPSVIERHGDDDSDRHQRRSASASHQRRTHDPNGHSTAIGADQTPDAGVKQEKTSTQLNPGRPATG